MDKHNLEIAGKVAQCVGDCGCASSCYLFTFLVSASVCVKVIRLMCNETFVDCWSSCFFSSCNYLYSQICYVCRMYLLILSMSVNVNLCYIVYYVVSFM